MKALSKGLFVIVLLSAIAFGSAIFGDHLEGWLIDTPIHGTALGEFEGIKVFAADGQYVRGKYGMEFQCVEYINRFYVERLHFHNMTITGDADSYFWNATEKGLVAFRNGSKTPPQMYDILVFDQSNNDGNPGHVAIVTRVDLAHGRVELVQQNSVAKRYGGLLKKVIPKESFPIEKNARGEWFMPAQRNRLPVAGWSRPRSTP